MRITAEMGCSASYWGGTSSFGNGAGFVPQELLQAPDAGLVAEQQGAALMNQAARFAEAPNSTYPPSDILLLDGVGQEKIVVLALSSGAGKRLAAQSLRPHMIVLNDPIHLNEIFFPSAVSSVSGQNREPVIVVVPDLDLAVEVKRYMAFTYSHYLGGVDLLVAVLPVTFNSRTRVTLKGVGVEIANVGDRRFSFNGQELELKMSRPML